MTTAEEVSIREKQIVERSFLRAERLKEKSGKTQSGLSAESWPSKIN